MAVTTSSQKSWYLLTSKPNQDKRAEEQLVNQGYRVYRPMAVRNRSRRGKLTKVKESLFPRYMFIHLDTEKDNWSPIKSTFGVSGIVKFGLEPARVPSSLVENLQSSAKDYESNVFDLDYFKEGDKVVLDDGPFAGLNGVFKNYVGEERVMVLLNVLSRETRVVISSKSLGKCS